MEIEISLAAEKLGQIGTFPITNTFWVVFAVSFILIAVFALATKKLQAIPNGLQFWAEVVIELIYGIMVDITGSAKMAKKYFPFIATLFLFFVTSNLMALLPGLGAITFHHHPLFRAATTDYNLLLAITLISFVVMQASGFIHAGTMAHLKKFINFSSPINFLVGLLELIGEFARILSLSFRFFGNLFAEEALLIVMMGLAPFIVPIPFQLLGIATAFIQPIIFMFIVLIFISLNSVAHGDESTN